MYVSQGVGMGLIARKLNQMSIPTMRNSQWSVATLNSIIRNPVYYGAIAFQRRPEKKVRKDGIVRRTRPRVDRSEWTLAEGKHEGIITKETWEKAIEILQGRTHPPAPKGVIVNPLVGLIRCGMCGRLMVRRPYNSPDRPPGLICQAPTCNNVSSPLEIVEEKILEGLKIWLEKYKAQWESNMPQNIPSKKESALQIKENIVQDLEKNCMNYTNKTTIYMTY
ncbi:recombinase family protein [Paenibacillus sp. OVF10]|nr:recombinase family protein [Paenibacillus sp. OVF10]